MKRRRRRVRKGQDYSVLEARQLLATTGLPQFDSDSSIETGLIVNGDFDQNDLPEDTAEHVALVDVPGWNRSTDGSDTVSLYGFEDSPRGTGLHLDFQPDVLESIVQDVNTESGQLYVLAFDVLGRPVEATAADTTNDVRVLWDNVEVGTFRGITDFWQTFTVDVTGGSADLTRLEIQEVDDAGNDGIGPMLDNVRLVPVTNQAVENGSFEDNASGIVDQADLPGWSVLGDEGAQLFDVRDDNPSDGSQFLNVDRLATDSDVVFTDIATEEGGIYFVSFDLRSESADAGQEEELRIRWNDEWVGTYRGNVDWQSFGFTVRADSDTTRLVFREPGDSFTGDGDGPLLDNVRITQVVPSVSLTLSNTAVAQFTEGDDDVELGLGFTAIDTTVTDSVTGFTASLPSSADSTTETLTVEGATGPVTSVDGVLNFTDASLTTEEILSVLQTLSYENTSQNPTAGIREIAVVVSASGTSSPAATVSVNVSSVNDAPVVATIADSAASLNQAFAIQAIGTDVDGDTLTWTVSAVGTAIEAGDAQPTIDANGNIDWTPARTGDAVFTVRATDPAGLFSETQFNVAVTSDITLDTAPVLVNAGSDLPLFDATSATDPAVGQTIANFEAQTINGETFNSIEPGVSRIYSVLAHWCPFCNAELPEIVEFMQEADLGDDVEFVAAAVAVDPTRDNYPPAEWFGDANYDGTIIVDSQQSRLLSLLGTQSFPFLVAVDDSGTVVERFSGTSTRAQLDAVLARLRA